MYVQFPFRNPWFRKHDFPFTFRLNQGLIENRSLASLDSIKEGCLYPELENVLLRVVAAIPFLALFFKTSLDPSLVLYNNV